MFSYVKQETSSEIYTQPIITQTDIFGQHCIDICLQAHLMADMGEIANPWLEFITQGDSLFNIEMCEVRFKPQGIQDQYFQALQDLLT